MEKQLPNKEVTKMASNKKTGKPDDSQAVIAAMIAQARKDGMIRASDLVAELEKLDLSVERIEQIYDTFESMGIQIVGAELELELDMVLLAETTVVLMTADRSENLLTSSTASILPVNSASISLSAPSPTAIANLSAALNQPRFLSVSSAFL